MEEKDKFGPDVELYRAYFKEDLDAIEEELAKSKEYSQIIDKEITALSAPGLATKGTQHYLIEHITNAVELQTQRQGLRKDRVAIKKLIMDYANRKEDRDSGDGDAVNLTDIMNKLMAQGNKPDMTVKENSEDIDSDIDKALGDDEK